MRGCRVRCAALILLAVIAPVARAGHVFPPEIDLLDPAPLTRVVIDGPFEGSHLGGSVASAGDLNGDGIDDLVMSTGHDAAGSFPNGVSYVVFGDPAIQELGPIDLATLDGSRGFAMSAVNMGVLDGHSVAGVGDFNGDGFDDVIVSGYEESEAPRRLTCYLVFGARDIGAGGSIDLASLDGTNGVVLRGYMGYLSGVRVSRAGDVNHDGHEDLLIAAPFLSPHGRHGGLCYVVFGRRGGFGLPRVIDLHELDAASGFMIPALGATDSLGMVAPLGDVNDDGIDDFVLGAPNAGRKGSPQGEAYVLFGAPDIGQGGIFDLTTLDGSNGFRVPGLEENDYAGRSICGDLDLNGDGRKDVVIGAPMLSTPLVSVCYVLFGGPEIGGDGVVDLAALDGTNGVRIEGPQRGIARVIAPAGDFDNDGDDELLLSASTSFRSIRIAIVLFGHEGFGAGGVVDLGELDGGNGFTLVTTDQPDGLGDGLSPAGDFNHDGLDDFVVTAPYNRPNGGVSGSCYVVFGVTGTTDPADLSGGGCVGLDDIPLLLSAWGTPDADLNGDGTTNTRDLAILLARWDAGCN